MPFVDVLFPVQGNVVPVDHGYHLYSAVSKILPQLHGDDAVGVHPISGALNGDRSLLLTDRSFLSIRLPAERVGEILPLAGKVLRVLDSDVRVGVPHARGLTPAPRLYGRLVVIKGFTEPHAFLDAVQRQLDALGVKGKAGLVEQSRFAEENQGRNGGTRSPFLRRTIRIRDKEVVGFALRLEELTAEESILVHEKGIGGRRRFGCGIFIPDRR
ncbi:MAG: type I-MYXAN CRISPR-associated protein Cas6/Cmx6 [Pseudomonadota bacterium]